MLEYKQAPGCHDLSRGLSYWTELAPFTLYYRIWPRDSVRSIVLKNFATKESSCESAKWETLLIEVLLLGKAEYVFWWGQCKKTTHRVDGVAQRGRIRESALDSFVHYRILFCASYSVVRIEVLVAERIIRHEQRPRNI